MVQYFFVYLLTISLIGAGLAVLDKWKAQHGRWRIPEKTLFLACALGGCPGVYFAMRLCRHKTLHKRFMWGIPAIFVLQLFVAAAIYYLKIHEGLF